MKCKTPSSVLKTAKTAGFNSTELSLLKSLIKDKQQGKLSAELTAKGRVNWHVTDEDWKVNALRGDIGLGFHVGTRDVVKDYHKQLYGKRKKPVFLHKVENVEELRMLELTDTGDGDWDVESMKKDIQARKADVDVSKVKTHEDMRNAILSAGYDGVVYENVAEGKGGELNSMIVMNTHKVKNSRKKLEARKELKDTDFDDLVLGSTDTSKFDDFIDSLPHYSNLVYNALDGQLFLRFNGARRATYAVLLQVRINYDTLDVTLVTNKGTYTFVQGQNRSKNTRTGKFVEVDGLGYITNQLIDREHEQRLIDAHLERMGSQEEGLHVNFKDENGMDVHGNTQKMQKLMRELNRLDANPATEDHLQQMLSLVGEMKPEFFTKMQTFVQQGDMNVGRVTPNKINVQVSKIYTLAGNAMSAVEVYAHELVHTYTMFGLRDNKRGSRLRRELRYLRDVLAKEVDWTVFLPEHSINAEIEERNAKRMWKYVFENETQEGLDEFLAHVLTNPMLSKKAKEVTVKEQKVKNTLFDRLTDIFATILDILRGRYKWGSKDKSVHEEAVALAHRLGEINNKALVAKNEKQNPVEEVTKWFNDVETSVSDKIKSVIDKLAKKATLAPLPKNASKLEYAKWLVKNMTSLIMKPELRAELETILTALGAKPEGLVQNVLRDFRTPDELERWLDKMNMLSGRLDSVRKATITAVAENVLAGFSRKLTKEEEEALTAVVLDTDMQSLLETYSLEELKNMLKDSNAIEEQIRQVKTKIRRASPNMYDWFTNQARGLGYFMVTGKANEAQNLNAQNIATGVLLTEQREATREEVALTDQLASLEALAYADTYEKEVVAKLIEDEQKGVLNVLKTHEGFIENSKDLVFANSTTNMIKGYSKELFNDSIAIEIAPASQQEEMKKKGYEKVSDLAEDEALGLPKMALYKSKTFNRQEYYRTATRLTAMAKRGTTVKEVIASMSGGVNNELNKINKTKLDTRRTKLATAMLKGQIDVEAAAGSVMPLLNDEGQVVDYRFTMSKSNKKEVLEQDTAISKVLGRSVASIADKAGTKEHNEKVLDVLLQDMRKNYKEGFITGHNGHEYIEVSANAPTEEGREIWKLLPSSMRKDIETRTGLPMVAVRRDMVLHYFGFRHWTLANAKLIKQLPTAIRTALKALEQLWQSIVSIAKVDILIRVPMVVIGNFVSNFMFGVMTGTGPVKLAKMYVEQARNIREYINKHKEYTRLLEIKKAGNVLKEDLSALPRLKADLEGNPIHELMEAGIYESIVEDLSEEDAKTNNAIGKYVLKKTEKLPQGVKTVWNWMTLNEHTLWYKNMEMLLRMGDLLGQATQNEKLKIINEKKLKKYKKQLTEARVARESIEQLMASKKARLDKERLEQISDEFIFYSKPASAFEEYLNRMGLVMFTKYAKRIQRIISKTAIDYPLRSLLVATFDNAMLDDGLETIMDQSVLNRSWYNFGANWGDLVERTVPIAIRAVY